MIFYIAKIRLQDYIQIKSGNEMEKVPQKYFDEMKETADVIYRHGWSEAFAGNMSFLLSEDIHVPQTERVELPCHLVNIADKVFLVTSTGSRMRKMSSQEPPEFCSLIKIDAEGKGYFISPEYPKKPTSELLAHLMVHDQNAKKKNNNTAIVHCHPENVITFFHFPGIKTNKTVSKILNSVLNEAQLLIPGGIGIVKDLNPGSRELAVSIREAMDNVRIVLMEKHGCISTGRDLNEALDLIEFTDKAIRIYFEIIKLKYKGEK